MAEHKKNKRPSSKEKHEHGGARRSKDAGKERGDETRRPPRRKPPALKGPWPVTSDRGQDAPGLYDAALRLMRSDTPDADAARRLMEEAVAGGDPRASYALATWYLHGTHVKKNLVHGVRLLRLAAEGKIRDALFDLAVSHETGRGVAKDRKKAFDLYKEAADLGDPQAMHEVGRMLYHGIGVAKDRAAAERWLDRAEAPTPSRPREMAR